MNNNDTYSRCDRKIHIKKNVWSFGAASVLGNDVSRYSGNYHLEKDRTIIEKFSMATICMNWFKLQGTREMGSSNFFVNWTTLPCTHMHISVKSWSPWRTELMIMITASSPPMQVGPFRGCVLIWRIVVLFFSYSEMVAQFAMLVCRSSLASQTASSISKTTATTKSTGGGRCCCIRLVASHMGMAIN